MLVRYPRAEILQCLAGTLSFNTFRISWVCVFSDDQPSDKYQSCFSSGRNPRMSACDPRVHFPWHVHFVKECTTETVTSKFSLHGWSYLKFDLWSDDEAAFMTVCSSAGLSSSAWSALLVETALLNTQSLKLNVQINNAQGTSRLNLQNLWRTWPIFLNKCSMLVTLACPGRCPTEQTQPRMKLLCQAINLRTTG